jgi:hypothetical protein
MATKQFYAKRSQERHEGALNLWRNWGRVYRFTANPVFVHGDIAESLSLLDHAPDTLVAVRMIYYLRDRLDEVFAAVARTVPNVVLCGNGNRAARWHAGEPDKPDGAENYYATFEGMRDLLSRHGYRIANKVLDGDEIVVGRKDG